MQSVINTISNLIICGYTLYNPGTGMNNKHLFPITFNTLVGFACTVAMQQGTYYCAAAQGWDEAGFWINATQVNGQPMSNVPFAQFIAIGT